MLNLTDSYNDIITVYSKEFYARSLYSGKAIYTRVRFARKKNYTITLSSIY